MGIDRGEVSQPVGQVILNRTGNGQNILISEIEALYSIQTIVQAIKCPVHIGQKDLSIGIQYDPAFPAFEQRDTDLLLQLGEIAAEPRLRDLELFGRLGQIAQPGNCAEIVQMFKIHDIAPSVRFVVFYFHFRQPVIGSKGAGMICKCNKIVGKRAGSQIRQENMFKEINLSGYAFRRT